jgi:hypothetical protein
MMGRFTKKSQNHLQFCHLAVAEHTIKEGHSNHLKNMTALTMHQNFNTKGDYRISPAWKIMIHM